MTPAFVFVTISLQLRVMQGFDPTMTAKGAELLARARELVPVLRARAAEAEKTRSIPPETIADLREAGLFRTLQPAVLGGHELPLDEAVLITATVAEGCGSTGWIQGIYSGHCATLGPPARDRMPSPAWDAKGPVFVEYRYADYVARVSAME